MVKMVSATLISSISLRETQRIMQNFKLMTRTKIFLRKTRSNTDVKALVLYCWMVAK